MLKAIVTGANGFIGSAVSRKLLSQGVQVTAVVHSRNERVIQLKNEFGGGNVHILKCDIEHIQSLPNLAADRDFDVFYHFAWQGSSGSLRADFALQARNAVASAEAVQVSKRMGCHRFISTGTITEHIAGDVLKRHYVSENLIYGLSKDYAHKLVDITAHKEKMPYVWAVLSNIYGGDNKTGNLISYTIQQFMSDQEPSYGPCLQPYNFTHIDDVVEALYLLGKAPQLCQESYLVSNGECMLLREYIKKLADAYGKSVAIGARSDDGVRYEASWFKDEALQLELGFKPAYNFEAGVKKLLDERI